MAEESYQAGRKGEGDSTIVVQGEKSGVPLPLIYTMRLDSIRGVAGAGQQGVNGGAIAFSRNHYSMS